MNAAPSQIPSAKGAASYRPVHRPGKTFPKTNQELKARSTPSQRDKMTIARRGRTS